MSENRLYETILSLASPQAASLGLEIWGLEVQAAGKSLVRLYVEGPEGVDIEQCAELSRLLGLALEVEDVFPGPYVLEVSSPGLERVYFTEAQLAGAVGEKVDVSLHAPLSGFPGRRRFKGLLEGCDQGRFSLRAQDVAKAGEETPLVVFTFDQVKKARRVHFDPEPEGRPGKPGKTKKDAAPPAQVTPRNDSEEII